MAKETSKKEVLIKKLSSRIFVSLILIILGYFFLIRISVFYVFTQFDRLLNSIILISSEPTHVKGSMNIHGEKRDLDFVTVKQGDFYQLYANFHSLEGIRGFSIEGNIEKITKISLGKKFSMFSFALPLVFLHTIQREGNTLYVALNASSLHYAKTFLFLLFLLIDGVFIFLSIFFLKQQRFTFPQAVGFMLLLIGITWPVLTIIERERDTFMRMGSLFSVYGDTLVAIILFYWFSNANRFPKRESWRYNLFLIIALLFYQNIFVGSLSGSFEKFKELKKILAGITISPMERKALAYSEYGELFRYVNFVNQIVPEHEKVALWGKALVFGNGSLVRRFVYPRRDCVLSSQLSTPEEFLKEFEKQDISYVTVLKKGMDSYSPWLEWPNFPIEAYGVYLYKKKTGEIFFEKGVYLPEKHLSDHDYFALIVRRKP